VRELLRAVVTKKPIIALLELDEKHDGFDVHQIRAKLLEGDSPCYEHGVQYPNKYAMWGLAAEVKSWGYALPTGEQLFGTLFANEAIEWNRIGAFQDVTIRLLATQIVRHNGTGRTTQLAPAPAHSPRHSKATNDDVNGDAFFVQSELANQRPTLREPVGTFHIYCSEHNEGSIALMDELATMMDLGLGINSVTQRECPRKRSSSSARLNLLRVSSEIASLNRCEHMLVYLNDQTWTRGESGSVQFAADVHQAMDAGVRLLLAHEMVGLGQDQRHPCNFGIFFACDRGTTPQELLHRGIYGAIATPLKGLQWRQASMAMLLNAISAGGTVEADTPVPIKRAGRSWSGRLNRRPWSGRIKPQSTTEAQQASVSVEMSCSADENNGAGLGAARTNAASVSAVTVDPLEVEADGLKMAQAAEPVAAAQHDTIDVRTTGEQEGFGSEEAEEDNGELDLVLERTFSLVI
jgi:hypothetical protein